MHDSPILRGAAVILLVSVLAPAPAWAYIGPGVGAGAVAAVLAVLGSILLGIFSVIYYPFKRMIRRRRNGNRRDGPGGSAE